MVLSVKVSIFVFLKHWRLGQGCRWGAFPFPRLEASLVMGVRLALLALPVVLEFVQAVVDNANNTCLTPCPEN